MLPIVYNCNTIHTGKCNKAILLANGDECFSKEPVCFVFTFTKTSIYCHNYLQSIVVWTDRTTSQTNAVNMVKPGHTLGFLLFNACIPTSTVFHTKPMNRHTEDSIYRNLSDTKSQMDFNKLL